MNLKKYLRKEESQLGKWKNWKTIKRNFVI